MLVRLAIVAVFCGLAGAASAQASLAVRAVDGAGAALAGLRVEIVNDEVGDAVEAATDAQGRVRFTGLTTAGGYVVRAGGDGTPFTEARTGALALRTGETRSVLLVVPRRLDRTLDEVAVSAAAYARVDAQTAEVSATLAPDEVRALPVEGRDVVRALARLPGVVFSTGFFPEAPVVAINGANGLYTTYLVDGLDNTENFLGGPRFPVPVGIVQDVTVFTNTFGTAYGRSANGVVNVTTRAGSNTPTAEALVTVRPGGVFDAATPFPQRDLSGNPVRDGYARQQLALSAGGPIARDRTFFFANLELTRDDKTNRLVSPALGVDAPVEGANRYMLGSLRLDHTWRPGVRSTARLHVGDVLLDRQGGGLDGGVEFPSAASVQVRRSLLAAVQTSALTGGWLVTADAQFSRFRWDYARGESGTRVMVLGPDGRVAAGLGNPGYTFDSLEETVQVRPTATTTRGSHTLLVGADVLSSGFGLRGGGPEAGAYTVQLTQAQADALAGRGANLTPDDLPADVQVVNYSVELEPGAYGARQTVAGVFVEDRWAVAPDATLTLGLRYDYDTISRGGASTGDWNNVAPRLGLNVRVAPRTSVRAGYGLAYDRVPYAVYSDALQQNSTAPGFRDQLAQLVALGLLPADTDLDRVTFDGNATVDATDLTPGYGLGPSADALQDRRDDLTFFERRILNPDGYDNPYAHQVTVGAQHQIAPSAVVSLDLVHTRSGNLPRLRDLNAPSAYAVDPANVVPRTPAEADATRPVALVAGGARRIAVTETAGRARYWGATLAAVAERTPLAGRLDAAGRIGYTLSSLRNDTDDINSRAADANDFEAEWGPSVNDRRHVLSAVGTLYAGGFSATVAALVQSGQPVNRVPDAAVYGTTDLNGDGDNRDFSSAYTGGTDRQPGESRNSDRLPGAGVVDVSLAYALPAVGGVRAELRADVFNVFDAAPLSGYANNATVSNQIQTGPAGSGIVTRSAGPPRQVQFTARIVW